MHKKVTKQSFQSKEEQKKLVKCGTKNMENLLYCYVLNNGFKFENNDSLEKKQS